jgi:3-oxoacyl-[acyl-carrier protein] reductase
MFSSKNVVITGAGRGIGSALALGFAKQGASVLVHYAHSQLEARGVVQQIKAMGGSAQALQAVLPEEAERLVAEAVAHFGAIDVWINNAGASANSSETGGLDEEARLKQVMEVDVMGTWRCCRAVATHIREGGCILNIGWNHALDGAPGLVSQLYATGKGAVIAMSRSMARELAPRVRVNCIAPGWIENEWARSHSQAFRDKIASQIPMQRWGTPEDIAQAALFLASPNASFITGQVLVVDGGEVMH